MNTTFYECLGADPRFIFYRNLGTTPQVWFNKIRSTEVPLEMNDDRIQNHMIRVRYKKNNPKPEGCTTTAHITRAGSPLPKPPFFPGECIQKSYKPANDDQGILTLSSGQALKSGLGPTLYWRPDEANGRVNYGLGISIRLSQKDVNRLNMAGNFIQELIARRESKSPFQASFYHPRFTTVDSDTFDPFEGGTIRPSSYTMICVGQSNSFDYDVFDILKIFGKLSDLYSFTLLAMAIIIIPAAYGGIHLGAIHTQFPSEIELTLWKSSCIILLGFVGLLLLGILGILALIGVFLILNTYLPAAIKSRLESWIHGLDRLFGKDWLGWGSLYDLALITLFTIASIVLISVVLLYVAARVFIVVESFISLRHVPIGVYRTPNTNFMSYIPHL
jgi:hypothetical protein